MADNRTIDLVDPVPVRLIYVQIGIQVAASDVEATEYVDGFKRC